MNITKMTEDDVGQVHEIECDTFSMPWSVNSLLEVIHDEKSLYLVVKEGGEVVGYCGLMGVMGEGYITNVAVKKGHQGKGIGRIMMEGLLVLGREKGLTAFTLEVRVSNERAISLYKSLGFRDVGVRKNFYESPTEDAMIMWLYD